MRFPEWRETLPVDMVDHMGIVHVESDEVADDEADESAATGGGRGGGGNDDDDDDDDETAAASSGPSGASARRAAISMRLRTMLRQLVDSMPLDDMVDQFVCQRFLFDRMPPRLSSHDASRRLTDPSVVTLDSKIRLTSARVARLAIEEAEKAAAEEAKKAEDDDITSSFPSGWPRLGGSREEESNGPDESAVVASLSKLLSQAGPIEEIWVRHPKTEEQKKEEAAAAAREAAEKERERSAKRRASRS